MHSAPRLWKSLLLFGTARLTTRRCRGVGSLEGKWENEFLFPGLNASDILTCTGFLNVKASSAQILRSLRAIFEFMEFGSEDVRKVFKRHSFRYLLPHAARAIAMQKFRCDLLGRWGWLKAMSVRYAAEVEFAATLTAIEEIMDAIKACISKVLIRDWPPISGSIDWEKMLIAPLWALMCPGQGSRVWTMADVYMDPESMALHAIYFTHALAAVGKLETAANSLETEARLPARSTAEWEKNYTKREEEEENRDRHVVGQLGFHLSKHSRSTPLVAVTRYGYDTSSPVMFRRLSSAAWAQRPGAKKELQLQFFCAYEVKAFSEGKISQLLPVPLNGKKGNHFLVTQSKVKQCLKDGENALTASATVLAAAKRLRDNTANVAEASGSIEFDGKYLGHVAKRGQLDVDELTRTVEILKKHKENDDDKYIKKAHAAQDKVLNFINVNYKDWMERLQRQRRGERNGCQTYVKGRMAQNAVYTHEYIIWCNRRQLASNANTR